MSGFLHLLLLACLVSLGSGAVKFSVECECEGFATYCLNDLGDMVQDKDCNDKGLKDSNGRVLRYGYCTGHSCSVGLANRSACFPASSRVMLFDANSEPRPVPIEDVRVGDELLVMAADGVAKRSPVTLLLHSDTATYNYLRLHHSGNSTLDISPAHLIPRSKPSAASYFDGSLEFVHASQLDVGDALWTLHGAGSVAKPVRLVQVEQVSLPGAFAPVTREGTIVVSAVAASCYAEATSHRVAHSVVGALAGIASFLGYSISADPEQGVHSFIATFYRLAVALVPDRWLSPKSERGSMELADDLLSVQQSQGCFTDSNSYRF